MIIGISDFYASLLGEKNSCYLPESTSTTFNLVKEAHPHQEYSWIQIPGYGHLDCIYGRDAVHDVYPHILKALDAHAQDDLHRDKAARRQVLRALRSLEIKPGMIVMTLCVKPHTPSDVTLLAANPNTRIRVISCKMIFILPVFTVLLYYRKFLY